MFDIDRSKNLPSIFTSEYNAMLVSSRIIDVLFNECMSVGVFGATVCIILGLGYNHQDSTSHHPFTIEMCVSDIESAISAVDGGATSLEVCSDR